MAETLEEKKKRVKKEFLSLWTYGHKRFYELIWEACELHERKNRGYATTENPLSNFYECEKLGVPAWQGCLVRMSDKWSRIQNLALTETGTHIDDVMQAAKRMENITDTLFDLGIYSFIDIILLEEHRARLNDNRKREGSEN